QLGLSWSAVDGILQRAVSRGLGRREPIATGAQLRRSNRLGGGALAATGALAVDEKAYKKRPNYLTVVSDGTHVLHVAEERREASLGDFLQSLTPAQSTAAQFRHSKRPGGGAKRTPYPVGQHGHVAALHSGHHQASAPRGP
ncbi:transposase, partial [Thiohalorhabdus sp.]